jgi:dephospho-CoA kinase
VLRVGLTGGIGTGKSYVRARFELRGLPTIDADVVAREVVAPGTAVLSAIRDRFGPGVFQPDGSLDRKALGALVFADPAARRALEDLVHPAVFGSIAQWFAAHRERGTPIVVADIPLLYETGERYPLDVVVVAACAPAEQLRRVMRRDGLTEADARARLDAQWPIDRKVARADYVIRTDGAFAETDRLVDEVVAALRERAAAVEQAGG